MFLYPHCKIGLLLTFRFATQFSPLICWLGNSIQIQQILQVQILQVGGTHDLLIIFFFSFIVYLLFEREKTSGGGAYGEEERESQVGSTLSVQSPMWGSNHELWDHDLSQNQDTYPTEPPRQLFHDLFNGWSLFSFLCSQPSIYLLMQTKNIWVIL